ncbi:anti-sigma factor domain-containing protein [Planococcus maritimus]|uniref:anti-sigma-I factor RsgI family protein n=1 Tax=Planococcus maritimus TaxID=192421 RepID=UPI00232DDC8C|nr:anti-sigma factor domain-containing protein [Planococcus maritimus]
MQMQKGICMELDGDRSVYMLADGRFVTGKPTADTVVGDEAYFEPVKVSKRRFKPFAMPLIASVAALFLFISTWMLPTDEAYGYVQVESNPGIEMGVNDDWHVISMRDLNEDGKQLIAKLADWENEEFEAVLQNVLSLSVDEDTEHVTITTVQEGDGTDATVKVEQIALAALFTGNNQALQIHLKKANKKQWREAKEQQVPVARLIEKDRTFTSPRSQENDVQPAQNEGIKVKQEPEEQEPSAKVQQPEPPKAKKENEPASTNSNKEGKTKKPDTQSKPGSNNNDNKKVKEPAVKVPTAPKETKKQEKPEPVKPKNSNAGKGNNSGNSKAQTKPKKEPPSSSNSKAEQPKQDSQSKGNPAPDKPKDQGNKLNKGKDNSNNSNSNGKDNSNNGKGNSNTNSNSSKSDKEKTKKPKD